MNAFRATVAGALLAVLAASPLPASATSSAATGPHGPAELGATPALALEQTRSLDDIVPELAQRRIVFVGETHTRYDHHLLQLHVIKALAARQPKLAIGVEWFQQPFQPVLDRYLAGEIDERTLLRESEYFERWRYDFRLYAPILRYAREQGIAVVALNLPTELIRAAGENGVDAVPAELRRWLPQTLDRSNTRYRERLQEIYASHPQGEFSDFERFYTVQLLWDEGMAERAAQYLDAHPDTRMVVLAGSGHLAYGDGIPGRLERQSGIDSAIVLSQWEPGMSPRLADYLLLSNRRELPPSGMLGVTIEPARGGGVRVREVSDDSPAERAGAQRGDRLVSIDGLPIAALADVRSAMWDKVPGDQVSVTVRRDANDDAVQHTLQVTLQ